MTQEIILNADSRERSGSNKARVIRKIDGMIPAVIYGNNIPGENIKLPLNELTKASENSLFYTQVLIIKIGEKEEKVVLKELQRDPAKGKFLHADFLRVSSKTKLKVTIPIIFINEDECIGVKMEGGVLIKALREIEVLCLAGNIPETIDVDVTNVPLGEAIRVTELDLPEGSEIVGLEDGQDQMVVSVNAPKAAEEEPVEDEGVEGEEGTDGEPTQGDESSDDAEGSEES
ncbi:50S ribosomal protein L25/general stress protein Ctc [Gammaproteobacteria bacterium]|jgi:large subunit ribosomal protein L25|nr:50S ribosomal protein L25/general stress protein Ctc [Gammaproteobacteria bacterium]MDB9996743.1 50S ribosomal protein L25/general stress protein Ctc [Gammaproteobacteria bacterium]|tara:strand:- start:2497 stop:3189 length:693 start_codon:yes stop_codon:yes gene_type:complete